MLPDRGGQAGSVDPGESRSDMRVLNDVPVVIVIEEREAAYAVVKEQREPS